MTLLWIFLIFFIFEGIFLLYYIRKLHKLWKKLLEVHRHFYDQFSLIEKTWIGSLKDLEKKMGTDGTKLHQIFRTFRNLQSQFFECDKRMQAISQEMNDAKKNSEIS